MALGRHVSLRYGLSSPAAGAPRRDRSARSSCGVARVWFILRRQDQETARLQLHRRPQVHQVPDPDLPTLRARLLDVRPTTPVASRDGTETAVAVIPYICSRISRCPIGELGFDSAIHPGEVPEEEFTAPACEPGIQVSTPDRARRKRGMLQESEIPREPNARFATTGFPAPSPPCTAHGRLPRCQHPIAKMSFPLLCFPAETANGAARETGDPRASL